MLIRFLASYPTFEAMPRSDTPEVAFVGRSNAGKSTALNTLWNHSLARTSKAPGRTRHINLFDSPHGQWVDLPGYGFAKMNKNEAERIGNLLRNYLSRRDNLRQLFWLMDCRHPLLDSDIQFLEFLATIDCPAYVLLTKADKLSKSRQLETLRKVEKQLEGISVQLFSALHKIGVEPLRAHITEVLTTSIEP